MDFTTLKNRLLHRLRIQLRNGQITERRLALRTGLSQSHIHNVLKGERDLTVEVADRILRELHMSVLDLFERDEIVGHMGRLAATAPEEPAPAHTSGRTPRGKYPGPVGRSSPN